MQFKLPSVISPEGLKRAAAILDTNAEVNGRTALLPSTVCTAIVERIEHEPKRCEASDATELVALLLRNYPDFRPHDAKGYTQALFDLFSAFPKSIGYRVVDPVSGLPARLKFNPKIADVSEALKTETKRRDLIRANALQHIVERNRREERVRAEAEFERNRPPVEERKRQVEALLGRSVKTI